MTCASFTRFCDAIDFPLEPFQRKIARAAFGPQHELLVLLPRGNGKTRLLAALAVHHLLSVERAAVYCAASSRSQASLLHEYAADFAAHPALDGRLVLRYLEIRNPSGAGRLKVLAADAPRLHGLTPSYIVLDEAHAAADDSVYLALRTSMMKRPDCRMVTISTAGQGADSFLGRLRSRALGSPEITRRGALTDAVGPNLRMLEWAVPDDVEPTPEAAAKANPASWITLEALRDQFEALPALAWERYHANRWTARESAVFPAGAWQACAGETSFEPGERIVIAVDLSGGGGRSDTAVCWLNERLHVGCEIWSGDHEPVAEVLDLLDELASTYRVVEVAMDFWRGAGLAHELEERGLLVSSYPQTSSRLIPASKRLYDAVLEQKLVHPDDPALNAHVSHSVSISTRRGWHIGRPSGGEPVDGTVALLMALDRIESQPAAVEFFGWL